jgi:hypothetical protein
VEVELVGQWHKSPANQLSHASFYYWQGGVRTKAFEYTMSRGDAPEGWQLNLQTVSDGIMPPPLQDVYYEFISGSIFGNCTDGETPSMNRTTPCLQGFVDLGDILSFRLNDTRSNAVSTLRAVHKQWSFDTDDAPSVSLRRVNADNETSEEDTVLVTTLTKPHHCNWLKICVASASSMEMIAPIGIILKRLDAYGVYCTDPNS